MRELFRCDDIAGREGEWLMYEAQVERLEEKLRLPLGSCMLAMPLWGEGINEEFNVSSKLSAPPSPSGDPRREAYVTVLHSKENYVCGVIMLAHRLRKTGSDRDLVLLHDKSIGPQKLQALADAGWALREIERIRSPHAKRGAYNAYNYSKLRIWQLSDHYDKVVFVDSDVLVLRNLDHLFRLPQMSAAGNSRAIFNSGVMVIEPSNCTFEALMLRHEDVVSYNGGDQGFLNEMFAWWHRLPRRVNFLKILRGNTTEERRMKDRLYVTEPATLYGLHYLGIKPWRCYRDYDCNWNVDDQRRFASDAAHAVWWRRHDEMGEGMRRMCGLTAERKQQLERERRKAEAAGYSDGHWRINVTDWRKDALID
uniref:Hexosyltransferase n=1 Tax=Ananas comosus var. bracteatus TaxID=296719 RepID=A0A6V7Q5D2_ANACO|nr:unnamed protein product [Ananas comosus var. bracteatus]